MGSIKHGKGRKAHTCPRGQQTYICPLPVYQHQTSPARKKEAMQQCVRGAVLSLGGYRRPQQRGGVSDSRKYFLFLGCVGERRMYRTYYYNANYAIVPESVKRAKTNCVHGRRRGLPALSRARRAQRRIRLICEEQRNETRDEDDPQTKTQPTHKKNKKPKRFNRPNAPRPSGLFLPRVSFLWLCFPPSLPYRAHAKTPNS